MLRLKEAGVGRSGKMRYHGYVSHVRAEGVDFSGRAFDNFALRDVVLTGCDFSGVKADFFIPSGGPYQSEFINCSFDRVNFKQVFGRGNRFVGCSFRGARISRWKLRETDLIDCDFDGAVLREVIVWGHVDDPGTPSYPARSWTNDVRGNDFSGARFVGSDFRGGVDLRAQRLPVGPDYIYAEDVPAALARGEEVLASLSPEDRKEARFILDWTQEKLEKGQEQMFYARYKQDGDSMWFPMRDAMSEV